MFVVTRETIESTRRTYSLEVTVDSSHRVVIDVLDYNPDTSHENVTVFDGRRSAIDRAKTRQWSIESDLADFPVEASGMALTIEWTVEGSVSGRFTFVLRSSKYTYTRTYVVQFAAHTLMGLRTKTCQCHRLQMCAVKCMFPYIFEIFCVFIYLYINKVYMRE